VHNGIEGQRLLIDELMIFLSSERFCTHFEGLNIPQTMTAFIPIFV